MYDLMSNGIMLLCVVCILRGANPRARLWRVTHLKYVSGFRNEKTGTAWFRFFCDTPVKAVQRGGGRWIRTTESEANRFTVCPL